MLQDANVFPHSRRAEADVEVGERDPEQTQPRPEQVATIETAHAAIGAMAERRFGEPVDSAARQVTQ